VRARAVAVAVLVATAATAAGASSGGRSERARIAFLRGNSVYFMNADGSGQHDARLPRAWDLPVWARDGRRMAFVSADTTRLYSADGDGRHRRLLARINGAVGRDWSPDGRKLAYQDETEVDFASISVVNADGTGRKKLTKRWNLGPVWSPRGRAILHAGHSRGWKLFVMSPTGRNRRALSGTGLNPTRVPAWEWSPDGHRIFFVRDEDVFVVGSNGGRARLLSGTLKGVIAFAVAPDGRAVALQGAEPNKDWEIYSVGADGTGLRQLTDNRGTTDGSPQWSPDGSKILFESSRDGRKQIYVMNADGSDQTNLSRSRTDDTTPTWVPIG